MNSKRQAEIVLAMVFSLFVAVGSARANQPVPPGSAHSVGSDTVAAALVARGISVQPSQVEFLAAVKSNHPQPALEIQHLQATTEHSLLARVRCREAGECLPFYVIVHLFDRQQSQVLEHLPTPVSPTQALRAAAPRPDWVVRTGESATFVLEGKDFRATAPVICLQNGKQGETIRVSSLDHKRIMVGEIVGPGLLHGAL